MSAASTYPTTVDTLPTTTVDNPDVSIALTQVESIEAPKYQIQSVKIVGGKVAPVDPRKGATIEVETEPAEKEAVEVEAPVAAAQLPGRQIVFVIKQKKEAKVTFASGAGKFRVPAAAVGETSGKVSTVVVEWIPVFKEWVQVGGAAAI